MPAPLGYSSLSKQGLLPTSSSKETYKAAQFYGLFVGSADGKLTSLTKITATAAPVERQELQLHQVTLVGTKIGRCLFLGLDEWLNGWTRFFCFRGGVALLESNLFLINQMCRDQTLKVLKSRGVHNWNQKQSMGFQEEMSLILMQQQHLIVGFNIFNSFSRSQLHGSCFYRSRLESMTWLCSSLTTWPEWPRWPPGMIIVSAYVILPWRIGVLSFSVWPAMCKFWVLAEFFCSLSQY